MRSPDYQIAVDIGGTFTDGVLARWTDAGVGEANVREVFVAKALTTPADPGDAIETVVRDLLAQLPAAAGDVSRVVHGTTLVTNTLVERRGARAAIVVTAGSEDALDIRRELRYDIYDLAAEYPLALIPREHRFALGARLGPDGSEWQALDRSEVAQVAAAIRDGGFEAVAVCLLHAAASGHHEQAAAGVLRQMLDGVPVSLSSEVASEIGEYERMSTLAANAYVQPVVGRYLSTLSQRLAELHAGPTLHVMLSDGGFTTARSAAEAPIRILESGPAGGVLSAVNCGAGAGTASVLAFDMGGTTAKACVSVDGTPALTHVFEFGRVRRFKPGSGLPALTPSIDLIEIGAGGGSIARVSALGTLQVGPRSAGSEPGPACYGAGGSDATVTDADLVLGYLDPDRFLGGRMRLDTTLARQALEILGAALGLDEVQTAWGIHDVVNENMASAARTHIAEKGLDARRFTLVATGGAGPVHAVDVARRLRIPRILCPVASGVGSCLGFLAAPARAERSWSRVEPLAGMNTPACAARIRDAVAQITGNLAQCGLAAADIGWEIRAEIRYVGQGNTVAVQVADDPEPALDPGAIRSAFEARYEALYHKLIETGVPELVTWRVCGVSAVAQTRFALAAAHAEEAQEARTGTRAMYLPASGGYARVAVYDRYRLCPGTVLDAPVVLVEPESTLVVPAPGTVTVLPGGTVEVVLDE